MRFLTPIAATCMGLSSCGYWQIQQSTEQWSLEAPQAWVAASKGNHGRLSTGWLKQFNQPKLELAVEQAIANNHNLSIAAARMREARQGAIIGRSNQLPSLDFSSSATVTDSLTAPTTENYRLSLAAAWEIDLWGRLRDISQASSANALAATQDFRAARLSLAANTAKAWCNLVSANQQVTLAEVTLDSFEKNLRIIERNYKGTGEGALDIQFGRNNVSSAKRSLESRKLDRDEAARTLELLLGRYPSGQIKAGDQLPTITTAIPAGLPTDLLERRPDIVAARARLQASARLADAARKALLPTIAITGSSGNTSGPFNELLDLNNLVHAVSGRFEQAILSGGRLTAEAKAALERNRAEIHRYAQTVLIGMREVESALATDRSLAKQEQFLSSELEQAVLAERQSERNYTEGINPNILSVLEAQRRANNARANMIRLRNQRLQNRIDLHLALGGDFRTPAP